MASSTSAVPVSVLDSMKCPICLDYATQAVETQCCEQIYCETCIQPLVGKECPSCRQPNIITRVSKIIRRMIGDLPAECPNKCGEKVTRDGLIDHEEKCPQREYQCSIKDCEFTGIKTEFIKHMVEAHPDEAFAALEDLAVKSEVDDEDEEVETEEEKMFYCPFEGCDQDAAMESNILCEHIYQSHHNEEEWFNQVFHSERGPIQIMNSEGRFANMARNGKFYCGIEEGSYNLFNKLKRNANQDHGIPCSIDSGLNCRSCMKLDVTLRNLPYGSLVNAAGHVSTSNFCTHPTKDSEYFSKNFGRSALCTHSNCKQTPEFSCKMVAPTCSEIITCKDCEALHAVYRLTLTVDEKKIPAEFYNKVWKRRKLN